MIDPQTIIDNYYRENNISREESEILYLEDVIKDAEARLEHLKNDLEIHKTLLANLKRN